MEKRTSIFNVANGEEIELKLSALPASSTNIALMVQCSLDGDMLETVMAGENAVSCKFQIRGKPVGELYQLMVLLHSDLEKAAEYKIELFRASESVHRQFFKRMVGQSPTNLIYTFSTHGSDDGSRG